MGERSVVDKTVRDTWEIDGVKGVLYFCRKERA